MPSPRRRRRLVKSLRRLRRRIISGPALGLLHAVLPPLYIAYMRLVWSTSSHEEIGVAEARALLEEHGGFVGLCWHEEIAGAPWVWNRFGIRPHTLINQSDLGDIVTRIAERCGCVVFRGGSSRHKSRRRATVVRDMIEHMQRETGVIYGIPVDGSRGPRYHMKRGPLVVARETGKPIVLARLWYRRCLRIPSWDQLALPLPWNQIRIQLAGPYFVPRESRTRGELEPLRALLERELSELAADSYVAMGQPVPRELPSASSPLATETN